MNVKCFIILVLIPVKHEPEPMQAGGGPHGGAPPGVREYRALEHRRPRHPQPPPPPCLGRSHNLPLQVRLSFTRITTSCFSSYKVLVLEPQKWRKCVLIISTSTRLKHSC